MEVKKFDILQTPIKSESDKNEYKVIRLENGLTATIISDNTTAHEVSDLGNDSKDEKIAVALYIEIGCLSDPTEIPGLSHFLEHMVHMGTEKFPTKNYFRSFIKESGGWENSYTDYDGTTFYFECFEKHIPEALDKFSQLFIAPLMKEEALTREREEIDCEFQMATCTESDRQVQLLRSLAKEGTPMQQCYPWGNLKTLKDNISDEQLCEALHEHRKRHYSAHRMTLAIQARLPMETLENLVVDNFSSIPSNNLPGNDFAPFSDGVFDTPEFNKIYYINPVSEVIELSVCWSLPLMKYEYKSKSIKYLYNLMENKGKGSILSYLKKHAWALSLRADHYDTQSNINSIFSLFCLNVELTEEGLIHVYDVIETIFSYINLLKSIGPQEGLYDELKCISDTDFRFEGEDHALFLTQSLVASMRKYPSEDFLRGSKLYYEYDPDKITMVLDRLTPQRVNISILSKKLPEGLKFDKTENWLGTEYTCIDITEELINKWEAVTAYPDFRIPPPNPYITKDFTLLPELSSHPEYPQKIIHTPKCELWYRQDQKFMLPTAQYEFLLLNPIFIESPKHSALSDMYVELLTSSIEDEKYPSSIAGLNCHFSNEGRGVTFVVCGYNENLPKLVELMSKYVKNLCDYINQEMFEAVKESLLESYHYRLAKVFSLSDELFKTLLIKNYFSPVDAYNELVKLTYVDMQEFIKHCHDRLYVKALIQGNVSPDTARDTVNKFINDLEFDEIPKEDYPKYVMPKVPTGEKCLRVQSLNTTDPSCGTLNYYQVGLFTVRDSAIMDIIIKITDEPVRSISRTKEQLCCSQYCSGGSLHGVLGYSLTVESQDSTFTTEYLDTRIEDFLKRIQELIETMSVHELEKIKDYLMKTKECCDQNLTEEVNRNFAEITSDEYMFDRTVREIEAIKSITLDDLKVWWCEKNQFGNKENFRKISVQVVGHALSEEETVEEQTVIKDTSLKILGRNENVPDGKDPDYFIDDIDSYKANLCDYPKDIEE